MKIVVIGGTGLVGSNVVARLREHGHEAVPAAPNTGVNTLTGEGLAEALTGADVVVDVSNSPDFADDPVMHFFRTSTTNILEAEKKAGTAHHVALSVVGTDRLTDSGYFRAKEVQENLIKDSGQPYSIVHATQFFEFVGGIADEATHGDTVRVSNALIQPMASKDVAAAVAKIAAGTPTNSTTEVGGPEKFGVDEFVRTALTFRNDPRQVVTDPEAPYWGVHLEKETLIPAPDAQLAPTRLEDWLPLNPPPSK